MKILARVAGIGLRALPLPAVLLFAWGMAAAQYTAPYVGLVGKIASANGMPAANYALTFTPTQVMFVGGTALIVGTADCATDSTGSVVGLGNPLGPPVTAVLFSGTLPAGNYQVEVSWYDTYGNQTLASPPVNVQLISAGGIMVSPPVAGAPAQAIGMNVYISNGSFFYQGHTVSPTASFTQSAPLSTATPAPISNSTVCQVVANDAAWPIAGYMATLIDSSGNTLPGFTKQVQFVGPGSAYSLSSGMPLWNGNVMYPAPILTVPYNHNAQSIAGPLSLTGYNIYNVGRLGVGTATPAYGVDVEGTGLDALINATGGYVVNGNGGSVGQCLASDGTAYDTPVNCLTSIGLLYYQTVDLNAVVQTQRPVANFSQRFSLTDSSSPARTNIDLDAPGTGNLVATETANPGSSTAFAQFDGNGNLTPSSGSFTTGSNGNGTWVKDPTGTITERGSVSMTNGSGTEATSTLTFPLTFPTGVQSLTVSPGNYANSSSNDAFMAYHVSLSTSGATLILRCAVNIGGSGCASISNTVPVYWIAIGN